MTISPPVAPLAAGQAPRVCTRPEFVTEAAGEEAIELAESVGLCLDPWQQLFVRVALAERADGKYAASEVAELVARQNGKGAGLEAVVLHGMFLVGDPLTLWTAHQFKTSTEAFLRIRGWIDGSDDLRRMVKKISVANGDEGIDLHNGARLRFIARSKSSGRGFSPQRIIFDEAQELSTLAVDAMLPSMAAQPNKQSLYAGTVPGPENNAEHWTRMRDRGRAGASPRLAWMEWTPEGSDDPRAAVSIDLASRKVWQQANPALGYRTSVESLEDDHQSMSPASFARERCSIWPDESAGGGVIPVSAWNELRDRSSTITDGPVAFALDVSPDRRASIGLAGRREDGLCHLEVVENGSGTEWVVPRLLELLKHKPCAVLLDKSSPAASLLPDLGDAGVEVHATTAAEMGQACGGLYDAVMGATPTVRHLGDPAVTDALKAAAKRSIGDGAWGWARKDVAVDISPLVTLTLARFGLVVHGRPTESIYETRGPVVL